MGFYSLEEIIKCLETPGIPGGYGHTFSGLSADTVIQCHLNNTAHIDIRHVGILFHASAQVSFHTAARVPVPSFT